MLVIILCYLLLPGRTIVQPRRLVIGGGSDAASEDAMTAIELHVALRRFGFVAGHLTKVK
jgi:hypothetical protein